MTNNSSPSSFYSQGPGNPVATTSPTPSSFYNASEAFNLVYYGAVAALPTVDPFGNGLLVGALAYLTTNSTLYIWTGSVWSPYPNGGTTLDFIFSSSAGVLTAGSVIYRVIPFNASVAGWTLLADVSGSAVLDVQQCTFAAFNPPTHPASGDSIAPSNKPTLTTSVKNQVSSNLGWANIVAGNVVAISLTSASTIHQLYLQLQLNRL